MTAPLSPGVAPPDALPAWAMVKPRRREHIARVAALMRDWAVALRLSPHESDRWNRSAWLHDALRDAPEAEMRRWAPHVDGPVELRHGPAAAARAELEGESDADVLSAVRWHSVGWAAWGPIGRALYCADFLEPGREFDRADRAALAVRFPQEPTAVVADVARRRLQWAVAQGWAIAPETHDFMRSLPR